MNKITILLITLPLGMVYAQTEEMPVIDVHMHCLEADWEEGNAPLNHITGLPSTAVTGAELLSETLREMDRLNVVLGLLSGSLECTRSWKSKSPGRFVIGPSFPRYNVGTYGTIEDWPVYNELEDLVKAGEVGVIGEITAQYSGLLPGDTSLIRYLELAEKHDLPVGIHTA